MNLNYTIFVDFFLYVKNIEHQTLVSFLLLTSIYLVLNHYISIVLMSGLHENLNKSGEKDKYKKTTFRLDYISKLKLALNLRQPKIQRDRRGCDGMVVTFTTTYAISTYHY